MENRGFEEYKLQLDYLKSQFDRLLNRFNYFLTVEIALFGFLGWLVFEKTNLPAVRVPALLGVLTSVLWYIVAAEDRALVEGYRERAEESSKSVGGKFADHHPAKSIESRCSGLLSWYWEPISVTRMPVHVALVTFILWLAVLAFGPTWLAPFARK